MVEPDNLEAQDHLTRLRLWVMLQTHGNLEDFQQLISKYLDEQVEQSS